MQNLLRKFGGPVFLYLAQLIAARKLDTPKWSWLWDWLPWAALVWALLALLSYWERGWRFVTGWTLRLEWRDESSHTRMLIAQDALQKCHRQIAEMRLQHFSQLRANQQPTLSVTIRAVGYERADVVTKVHEMLRQHTQWDIAVQRLDSPEIEPKRDADITVSGNGEIRFPGVVMDAVSDLLGYQVRLVSLGHDSSKHSVTIDVHPLPRP